MIDPEDLSVSDEPLHRGPGPELANARERAGIALEAMAETLHLAPAQLEALERDDHARLPPPTFVRGYLRAYARELGLDADAIISSYDASGAPVRDPELRATTPAAAIATGHGTIIGMALVLIVAGGGAGAWWLQGGARDHAVSETPAAADAGSGDDDIRALQTARSDDDRNAGDAVDADDIEAVASTGQAAVDGFDSAAVGDDAAASTASEPAALEVGAEQSNTSGAEAAQGEGAAGTRAIAAETDPAVAPPIDAGAVASEVAEGDGSATAAEAEATVSSSPAAAISTAAATGPDRLVLEFAGPSWLEINDTRGRELAYTLYRGSRAVTVRGWAPFEVFLGNSPAVTIRLNGEEIDKTAFTRSDNTGRFTVDAAGARRR